MNKKGVPKGPFWKFLLVDLLVIFGSLALAFLIRFQSFPFNNFSIYIPWIIPILWVRIGGLFIFRLYDFSRGRTIFDLIYFTALASIVSHGLETLALLYTSTFIDENLEVSRWILSFNFLLSFAGALAWRVLYLSRRRRWAYDLTRILIVGAGELGESVKRDIKQYSSLGHQVVGLVDDDIDSMSNGSAILGKMRDLNDLVENHKIDEIIVTSQRANRKELLDIISACQTTDCKVYLLPELYEVTIGQVEIGQVAGVPLIAVDSQSLNDLSLFNKRAFDLIFASVALLVFLPFLPLIALAIKRSGPGPVFYRQERIGRNGEPFTLYKFRTMDEDAETTTGPVLSWDDDPRVTKAGRVLRRWHIDEIPQFYNVLRGEMSLVGPRPERPNFAREYEKRIPAYRLRESIRPGMTGLAQIHGFYNSPVEHKLRYDLAYINNMSFLLDLKILSNTLRVTLSGHGIIS